MRKVISFDKELEFKTMIGEVTSISLDQHLSFQDDSTVTGELVVSGKYKLTAASRLEEDFSFHLPMEIVLTERLDPETRNVNIEDFRYEVEDNDILLCHIDLLVEGVEIIDDVEGDSDEREDIIEKSDAVRAVEVTSDSKSTEEIQPVQVSEIVTPVDFSTPSEPVSPRQEVVSNDTSILSNPLDQAVDVDVNVNINTNTNTNANDNINTNVVTNSTVDVDASAVKDDDTHDGVRSLFSSFKDSDETFATYSVYIFRANDTIEMIMDKYQVTKEELENYNDLSSLTIGSKVIIPTHIHE